VNLSADEKSIAQEADRRHRQPQRPAIFRSHHPLKEQVDAQFLLTYI